jgi:hypothetical protein
MIQLILTIIAVPIFFAIRMAINDAVRRPRRRRH